MKRRWLATLLFPFTILVGGSTFVDPVDAPRFQVHGNTIIDGQRNATFSAIAGTTGTFSGAVAVGNLSIAATSISKSANFPANVGEVFASGATTLWLPAAAQTPIGRLFRVWNVGSNTVTLATTGSDTFSVFGANNAQIGSRHSMTAICRSSSSWIIQVD